MSTDKPGAAACDEQSLLEFLDGSLPVHRRPLVESHLERCQACRQNLAGFQQTLAMASTVPVPAMDPFVSSGFGARVRASDRGARGLEVMAEAVVSRIFPERSPVPLLCCWSWRRVIGSPSSNPGCQRVPALLRNRMVVESPDFPGIDEFLESATLWYGDEVQLYGGDFLAESSPPDLDSEVSRYLLETASESELLEQMQLLVEGEDIYALTAEQAK